MSQDMHGQYIVKPQFNISCILKCALGLLQVATYVRTSFPDMVQEEEFFP